MPNKIIVSLDVEDWYHGPTVISPSEKEGTLEYFLDSNQGAERAYKYIDQCLQMLDTSQVKATFFWVAEYAKRHKVILRSIVNQGHEIACHGLDHYSKLNRVTKSLTFSPEEFALRTITAKRILEDLSGDEIIGYRAPNAYFSGELFDVLEDLGFRYDSSVSENSIYNKTDSRLDGVGTAPYYPARGGLLPGVSSRNIIEFPWSYFKVGAIKLPSSGGPFLRLLGSKLSILGLRQSLEHGHAVFYFHPLDICKEDIPLPFNLSRPMLWALKGDLIRRRIESVLSEFKGQTSNFKGVLDGGFS